MKTLHLLKSWLGLAALLGALCLAPSARATSYFVSLDTSAIAGPSTGPFYLDFVSIFGSGSDQTATLSNFVLTGGGFLSGTEQSFGTVSGSLAGGLTLSSGFTSAYNEFFQQFESTVTSIKFTVDLTTNVAAGIPSAFAVSILDGSTFPIPTTGFGDTLVLFSIDGTDTGYATAVSTGGTAGVTASVPDAGATGGLMLGSLVMLGVARGLRRKTLPMAA